MSSSLKIKPSYHKFRSTALSDKWLNRKKKNYTIKLWTLDIMWRLIFPDFLVQAQYWHDPLDLELHVSKSKVRLQFWKWQLQVKRSKLLISPRYPPPLLLSSMLFSFYLFLCFKNVKNYIRGLIWTNQIILRNTRRMFWVLASLIS